MQTAPNAEKLARVTSILVLLLVDEKMASVSTNYTYKDYFQEHVNFVLIVKLNYGDMTACMFICRINYHYSSFV